MGSDVRLDPGIPWESKTIKRRVLKGDPSSGICFTPVGQNIVFRRFSGYFYETSISLRSQVGPLMNPFHFRTEHRRRASCVVPWFGEAAQRRVQRASLRPEMLYINMIERSSVSFHLSPRLGSCGRVPGWLVSHFLCFWGFRSNVRSTVCYTPPLLQPDAQRGVGFWGWCGPVECILARASVSFARTQRR